MESRAGGPGAMALEVLAARQRQASQREALAGRAAWGRESRAGLHGREHRTTERIAQCKGWAYLSAEREGPRPGTGAGWLMSGQAEGKNRGRDRLARARDVNDFVAATPEARRERGEGTKKEKRADKYANKMPAEVRNAGKLGRWTPKTPPGDGTVAEDKTGAGHGQSSKTAGR